MLELMSHIGVLWNIREFVKFREAVKKGWIIPLLFIIPGAFLGFAGLKIKLLACEIGMIMAAFHLINFLWQRAAFVVEIVAAIDVAKKIGKLKTDLDGEKLAIRFLEVTMAVLASEIAIGFIGFLLPAHRNPSAFFLLIPAGIGIVAHTAWKGGGGWWAKATLCLPVAAIFIAVPMTLWPSASETFLKTYIPSDECLVVKMKDEAQRTKEEKDLFGRCFPEENRKSVAASAATPKPKKFQIVRLAVFDAPVNGAEGFLPLSPTGKLRFYSPERDARIVCDSADTPLRIPADVEQDKSGEGGEKFEGRCDFYGVGGPARITVSYKKEIS